MTASTITSTTRVFLVEDELVAARALADHIARVPGFEVGGHARTGTEAVRRLSAYDGIDLIMLDIQLPDMTGLDVLRRLRGSGCGLDVIAVTIVRDLALLQTAISLGVVQYLLKPFTAATMRRALERYQSYRSALCVPGGIVAQQDVDAVYDALHSGPHDLGENLPKGIARDSLRAVATVLRATSGVSAAEMAAHLGISRVTARRYLEYLADIGLAARKARYGGTGRPETEYWWVATGS